jgi:hypothetical protein
MNEGEGRANQPENPVSNQDQPETPSKRGEPKRKVDRMQFEHFYKPNLRHEMYRVEEDRTFREFTAYELRFDATKSEEREKELTHFALMALRAGYTQALGPVVLPNTGYREGHPDKPLTSVYFFLEKPLQKPSPEEGEKNRLQP